MSEATTEKKRTRNKRAYIVQAHKPAERVGGPEWADTTCTGENEADALKSARAQKLTGKIRVVAVCGVYNLAEKVETKIGVSRVE